MDSSPAITLRDARRLGYCDDGPRDGLPILGFHGTPNSRLVHPGDGVAASAGVRLVLPDRPGLGRSDFKPGRTLAQWPDDVAELADALGLDRFGVFGVSGGGPHAAACAALMPERVVALGLVSAVGPWRDSKELDTGLTAENAPWARAMLDLGQSPDAEERFRVEARADLDALAADPERWLDAWAESAPRADRILIRQAPIRAMYVQSCREATLEGYTRDLVILFGEPWGFRLEDIRVPTIVWHGGADPTVPGFVGRHLAERIPGSELRFDPDGGHLVFHDLGLEILESLRRLAAGR